jgi:hypothetical protein
LVFFENKAIGISLSGVLEVAGDARRARVYVGNLRMDAGFVRVSAGWGSAYG